MTDAIAAAVAQRSGWKALVFPTVPLGTAGANEIGGSYSWPGTYSIRASTLRAVFMDLADELGTQGFRWAFIIHGHGAPRHNRALDEVEDYFRDTYRGRMVHLMGREPDMSAYDAEYARRITTPFGREDGDSPHAGIVETSIIAYLRPDLLAPSYKQLRSLTPAARDRLPEVATAPGWPGYFGAPQFATAEIGRFLVEANRQEYVKLAMRILDGFDERSVPRYADAILSIPGIRAANDRALEHEGMIAKRQEDWVTKHSTLQMRDSVDELATHHRRRP
jgi:creatinine amidohydrolase/Fe(II)-dependent formamide hydrolase-like protein